MMSETLPTNFSYDHEYFSQSPSSSSFGIFSSMANSSDSTSSTTQITSPNSKPIKRRSRSSKKTPATLLNANTSNFRALVQQFTGCPRTTSRNSSSSLLIGCQKGPVTLNFKLGSVSLQKDHSIDHGENFSAYHNFDHQLNVNQSQTQQQQDQDHVVEMKSSKIDVVDDLEMMMMMMGDHGVDLTDDIACDHLLQPVVSDHDYFWNYMNNNQYSSLS